MSHLSGDILGMLRGVADATDSPFCSAFSVKLEEKLSVLMDLFQVVSGTAFFRTPLCLS